MVSTGVDINRSKQEEGGEKVIPLRNQGGDWKCRNMSGIIGFPVSPPRQVTTRKHFSLYRQNSKTEKAAYGTQRCRLQLRQTHEINDLRWLCGNANDVICKCNVIWVGLIVTQRFP